MQESQHRRKSSIKKHPATATMISKQPLLSHIFSHNRKKGEDDTKPMESGSTAFPLEEISCLEFIRETISEGILLTFMMCVVFQYGVLYLKKVTELTKSIALKLAIYKKRNCTGMAACNLHLNVIHIRANLVCEYPVKFA
jgi:hypothetical protein